MVPSSVPAVPVLLLWFKNVGGGRKYVRYLHHIHATCSRSVCHYCGAYVRDSDVQQVLS